MLAARALELTYLNSVSPRDMCVNWNEPAANNYTSSLALARFERRLNTSCTLVDANRVCPGIKKVRVEPATKSAVAIKKKNKKKQLL